MEEYYEDEPQGALPFDDDFYEAVDASIFRCVNEVVTPMEQRLTDRIVAECAKLAQAHSAGPAVPTVSPSEPPPKKPCVEEAQGVDKDAFERLREAFFAKESVPPPVPASSGTRDSPPPPPPPRLRWRKGIPLGSRRTMRGRLGLGARQDRPRSWPRIVRAC